jgi:hypothetical protein
MSKIPSIKGSIVANHAEVMHKYLAKSQMSEKEIQRRFETGELEILSAPIDATRWYDIRMYRRLLEFLRDYPGEGHDRYLIDAGRRSAENLIRAGIHQQMEYLRRTQVVGRQSMEERSAAFGRDLRLLTSITGSILNFAVQSVVQDPAHAFRWIIQHTDARDYPEVLCWTTQGFCNRMAEEHDAADIWYWERPRPDVVHFRMNREI